LAVRSERGGASGPPPILDPFGRVIPRTDDPAFQPPKDPLTDLDSAKADARIIYRQIPITTIQTDWTVAQTRMALNQHVQGIFDQSAQLVDAIVGDDRIQATLGSRTGGLFGRPVRFKPANDSSAAREVCDAWSEDWDRIMPEPTLRGMGEWTTMMGFMAGPLTWDTTGDRWVPMLAPWHPRYSFYLPQIFSYVATTQDGLVAIKGGTGKWFLHAPHGEYRGWMRGAVRPTAQPWLIRNMTYRDWARYSERHGMPILRAYTPAAGDPQQRERFVSTVANIGQETAVMLPKGVDEQYSFDLDYLEASDQSWQAFPGLIDRCDMSIVLAILFQNLTTEVKEGSFAAARVHGDVRQSALASDNNGYRLSIRNNIARPYAAFNFGDPELAPWTDWDLEPIEDRDGTTKVFLSFCQGLQALTQAGYQISDPNEIRTLAWNMSGLRLGKVALEKAVQVAKASTAMAKARAKRSRGNTGARR